MQEHDQHIEGTLPARQRAQWRRPVLHKIDAESAEEGVNPGLDGALDS
jgi:hypothetical protein